MVNFAELKAQAAKAKDTSVTKMTNTRDKYISVPSSKTNWDPNWKRAPPPPPSRGSASSASRPPPALSSRSRPDITSENLSVVPPLPVPRGSRPVGGSPPPPTYIPPPPPTRLASGYPPSPRDVDRIDWTNLSPEDKEEFFGWLDEFFSRYLNIELSPRAPKAPRSAAMSMPAGFVRNMRPPPMVNMASRP
ncbi:hypothetical protein PAXRUDRAFT_365975 [Paxillus rubicundulus Ve08.2h10]|uniref:Uncharacterized protein n=1 Tax=Paxillus rubicundulus Ve08.2h10 TaxID=930991 RepID=A0A0D0DRK2_9AGAM|nr:hypothetical protein PAXRUDRAFT_365975 [Paxillus rubicundulus Ve08.2h10]